MSSPTPIFVAGTGRSGTSRLADIIGQHPLIHRIPMETRFLIDPGGLRDLADALTDRYDPTVGEDALHRLSDFLTVRVPGRRDDRGKTVPELVGEHVRDQAELWAGQARTELEWAKSLSQRLSEGAYTMADDPGSWRTVP